MRKAGRRRSKSKQQNQIKFLSKSTTTSQPNTIKIKRKRKFHETIDQNDNNDNKHKTKRRRKNSSTNMQPNYENDENDQSDNDQSDDDQNNNDLDMLPFNGHTKGLNINETTDDEEEHELFEDMKNPHSKRSINEILSTGQSHDDDDGSAPTTTSKRNNTKTNTNSSTIKPSTNKPSIRTKRKSTKPTKHRNNHKNKNNNNNNNNKNQSSITDFMQFQIQSQANSSLIQAKSSSKRTKNNKKKMPRKDKNEIDDSDFTDDEEEDPPKEATSDQKDEEFTFELDPQMAEHHLDENDFKVQSKAISANKQQEQREYDKYMKQQRSKDLNSSKGCSEFGDNVQQDGFPQIMSTLMNSTYKGNWLTFCEKEYEKLCGHDEVARLLFNRLPPVAVNVIPSLYIGLSVGGKACGYWLRASKSDDPDDIKQCKDLMQPYSDHIAFKNYDLTDLDNNPQNAQKAIQAIFNLKWIDKDKQTPNESSDSYVVKRASCWGKAVRSTQDIKRFLKNRNGTYKHQKTDIFSAYKTLHGMISLHIILTFKQQDLID